MNGPASHRTVQILLALCFVSIPLALMLFFPPPPPVQAAALTVTTTADAIAADGFCSLREAIQAANTNLAVNECIAGSPGLDTITITATGTIALGSALPSITQTLVINGPGASLLTISGNNTVQVLQVAYPFTLHLSDVKIANGKAGEGGGIANFGTLYITNTNIYSNTAMGTGNNGGGIYNNGGTVNIVSSNVYSNTSTARGGGIANASGTVNIINSNIYSNTAVASASINVGGGGIFNTTGGSLNITNSNIYSNSTSGTFTTGGGIWNWSTGIVTVTNSIISGNSSPNGGGIYNLGTVSIMNTAMYSNTASGSDVKSGGGILNEGGSLTINNSTFSGNTAGGDIGFGGGIFISGTLTMTNSTLSGNIASGAIGEGGGMLITGTLTTIVITNTTFAGNIVSATAGSGGGIFMNAGTMTATNSTLANNSAGTAGGGIRKATGTVTLRNTIIANSPSGGNCSGIIGNGGNNLQFGGSVANSCGGTILTMDPLLGPLANNGGPTQTMALLPGSPAIDAANDANCPSTDQRGAHRPIGAHCDIGAYEAGYLFLPLILK